jgi:hypothetical protein
MTSSGAASPALKLRRVGGSPAAASGAACASASASGAASASAFASGSSWMSMSDDWWPRRPIRRGSVRLDNLKRGMVEGSNWVRLPSFFVFFCCMATRFKPTLIFAWKQCFGNIVFCQFGASQSCNLSGASPGDPNEQQHTQNIIFARPTLAEVNVDTTHNMIGSVLGGRVLDTNL